eukprot:TRINITY_DN9234_c0_g1_i1.p1 TRINITY_DN9234_c0_g1~~TRINITY_DN9234_c0_g1_i1.p1  ORF type:complete len:171 (+),score=38.67 TRINITY_DN9234_c0_g1_i1:333-845(+)
MTRTRPNILITGTPGTGKTSTADNLSQQIGFTHIDVSGLVKDKGLHEGKDEELDTYIIDEDLVCDELENMLTDGGVIVDYHGCDFFPERWFDLVVVLRTDNSVLYRRLESRGYKQRKISENIECEIMQVVLDEAADSYKREIIQELQSNNMDDMERNIQMIATWVEHWHP